MLTVQTVDASAFFSIFRFPELSLVKRRKSEKLHMSCILQAKKEGYQGIDQGASETIAVFHLVIRTLRYNRGRKYEDNTQVVGGAYMNGYTPPFAITNEILALVSSISEKSAASRQRDIWKQSTI